MAHPGYENIYSADSYAMRSTGLKDNYFIRNGKADEWAGMYVERIQKHLDVRDESFSIDAETSPSRPASAASRTALSSTP